MIRKAILATVVLVFVGVGPSIARATVFHDKDIQHELDAGWSSCGPGTAGQPCAVTQISGYESFYTAVTDNNGLRDCVRVGQTRGISHGDGYVDVAQPFD